MMSGQLPSGPERRIDRLLAAYDDGHRSLINRVIHWISVPVMVWCVLAFLSAMPFPAALRMVPGLSWGVVGAALICLYYLVLSPSLAAGMAVFSLVCLVIAGVVARTDDTPLWQVALFIYVIVWVVQIGGYRLEARPPTFREDARFLVTGPAWLIAALFRRVGIRY
jgi:uncharacterized membrane protein YGL010W